MFATISLLSGNPVVKEKSDSAVARKIIAALL
jgi:uncharacterized protein YlzI (FlbEa/FlbD family)